MISQSLRGLISLDGVSGAALLLNALAGPADAHDIDKRMPTEEVGRRIRFIAKERGIDPASMERMGRIESNLDQFAYNKNSKAAGVFQFIPSTARGYGLNDPFNVDQNIQAAASLWNDNKKYLASKLGYEPTAGMIYLAHQQGAYNAVRLIKNPGRKARDIVGLPAVVQNGGHKNATAAEFANMWIGKFE